MIVAVVIVIAKMSTQYIPEWPTRNPLMTEVTRNEIPDAVPASPFALSLLSSGIRIVIMVGSAMVRILPAITPIMRNTTNIQSVGLAGSLNEPGAAVI